MANTACKEGRSEARKKTTLFCRLIHAGKRHPAVLLDLSGTGVFVRTGAALPLDSAVKIILGVEGERTWTMSAVVVREPQSNLTMGPTMGRGRSRGLGLRLIDPPKSFAEFVDTL